MVAVILTIWLAGKLGLELRWPSTTSIVIFVPLLALLSAVMGTLLRLICLPLTCLTLGAFGALINIFVFWIAAAATGAIMDFKGAVFGWLCYSLVSAVLGRATKES